MTDESHGFSAAKVRLEEIVAQVRKKDTSLEKSLDLLEEGVRLANVCTELIDHADWNTVPTTASASSESAPAPANDASSSEDEAASRDVVAEAEASAGDELAAEAEDRGEATRGESDENVGDVWSDDEAWADEAEDPSDGDDGQGA